MGSTSLGELGRCCIVGNSAWLFPLCGDGDSGVVMVQVDPMFRWRMQSSLLTALILWKGLANVLIRCRLLLMVTHATLTNFANQELALERPQSTEDVNALLHSLFGVSWMRNSDPVQTIGHIHIFDAFLWVLMNSGFRCENQLLLLHLVGRTPKPLANTWCVAGCYEITFLKRILL